MTAINPFEIVIDPEAVTDLQRRLMHTRWPDEETPEDWSQGVPLSYMKELVAYWGKSYDHQRLATRLNVYDNYKSNLLGLDIHFLHVRSTYSHARPLLLTHGWPGSVVEFLNVIGPLTEPKDHGGKPEDAFHLVIPSLPGYGFSAKPEETGWACCNRIWDAFSVEIRKMFIPGRDSGSFVARLLARDGYGTSQLRNPNTHHMSLSVGIAKPCSPSRSREEEMFHKTGRLAEASSRGWS